MKVSVLLICISFFLILVSENDEIKTHEIKRVKMDSLVDAISGGAKLSKADAG